MLHARRRRSHMHISSCEMETRRCVSSLLNDRKPLSHELTPVYVMERRPWLGALYQAPTLPLQYFNSPLRLTILLLQAYYMKPIHLFSVKTWQGALISDGTSVLRAPGKCAGTEREQRVERVLGEVHTRKGHCSSLLRRFCLSLRINRINHEVWNQISPVLLLTLIFNHLSDFFNQSNLQVLLTVSSYGLGFVLTVTSTCRPAWEPNH